MNKLKTFLVDALITFLGALLIIDTILLLLFFKQEYDNYLYAKNVCGNFEVVSYKFTPNSADIICSYKKRNISK